MHVTSSRSRRPIRAGLVPLAAVLALLVGSHALAATIDEVRGTNGFGVSNAPCGGAPGFDIQEIDGSGVSGAFSTSGTNCQASVSAEAGGGVVAVEATYTKNDGDSVRGRVLAFGSSSYDIVLIPPASYTGGLIPFSFAADLSGSVSAFSESLTRSSGRFGVASIEAQIGFTGRTSNFNVFTRTDSASVSVTAIADQNTPVDVANDSLPGALQTDVALIDPTRLLTIGMSMTATAGAAGFGDFNALGIADASQSLTFRSEGPVFDLPDGWSVDVPEANIFDNVWFDPREVPEPSTAILAIAAMGLLAGCRTSRTR